MFRTLRKNDVLQQCCFIFACLSSPSFIDHSETFTSSDSSEYQYTVTGLCENAEPHGKGWKVWANCDTCKGSFRQGLRGGRGFYKYANGARDEGEWRSNKKDGEGKMVLPNGDSYGEAFRNAMRPMSCFGRSPRANLYSEWLLRRPLAASLSLPLLLRRSS
jgi:hypothetical protein